MRWRRIQAPTAQPSSFSDAETRAAELCQRALDAPALRGWQLGRVGVPLVAAFYEWQLTEAGLRGRNGTGPNPSTREPFHRP
ncbi:hypothetical protein [Kitasatospora aureofaciens]|uniref:hypothetical protein n=1 Tax=Kitasatospora aureofaciens TaxID=1894 RepID=UPI0036F45FC4